MVKGPSPQWGTLGLWGPLLFSECRDNSIESNLEMNSPISAVAPRLGVSTFLTILNADPLGSPSLAAAHLFFIYVEAYVVDLDG